MGRRLIFIFVFLSCSLFAEWDYEDTEILKDILDSSNFIQEYTDYTQEYIRYLQPIETDTSNIRANVYDLLSELERQGNTLGYMFEDIQFSRNYIWNILKSVSNSVHFAQSNTQSLSNIVEQTYQSQLNTKDIFNFLNSSTNYNDLVELLGVHYYDTEAHDNERIISLLEDFYDSWSYFTSNAYDEESKLIMMLRPFQSTLNTINSSIRALDFGVDMGIVTNIYNKMDYTIFTNINDNVIAITNILVEAGENEFDYSYEGEQANNTSVSLVDDATHMYNSATNQLHNINKEYGLHDVDFDFSTFTNFSERVTVIKNDYDLQSVLTQTNQLVVASQSLQTEINNQFSELESFTHRSYSPVIVWRAFVKEPIEINLQSYLKNSLNFRPIWDFVIWILTVFYCIMFLKKIWGDDNGE